MAQPSERKMLTNGRIVYFFLLPSQVLLRKKQTLQNLKNMYLQDRLGVVYSKNQVPQNLKAMRMQD